MAGGSERGCVFDGLKGRKANRLVCRNKRDAPKLTFLGGTNPFAVSGFFLLDSQVSAIQMATCHKQIGFRGELISGPPA